MSVLCLFMVSSVVHFCQSQVPGNENKMNRMSLNKPRDVETYTTILLDDEAYSIEPAPKTFHKQASGVPLKVKGKIPHGKLPKTSGHRLEGNRLKGGERKYELKKIPKLSVSIAKNVSSDKKKDHHSYKHFQKQPNKAMHLKKRSHDSKKKLQKRYFDAQQGSVWNFGGNEQRYEAGNRHMQNYRFVLNPTRSTPAIWHSDGKVTANPVGAPTVSNIQAANEKTSNDFARNFDNSPWGGSGNYGVFRPERQPNAISSTIASTIKNIWSKNESILNPNGFNAQNNGHLNVYQQPVTTTVRWSITSYPTFSATPFSEASIVPRNVPSTSAKPKSENEKLEDQLRTDEAEADDTDISIGSNCDVRANETCWMKREIGDVVTLSVKIESSKSPSSFQVRWLRVYHVYNSKKGKPLELGPDKLPWNMVSGSEGRELRLNPVTNTDIDPNCIVAKVFLLTKRQGKVLYTHMKRLIFRIDISITDMGVVYAGEELSINLENFISLPERGNLLFDWNLETKPHEPHSLPSNVKISNSGRSVILKELRKGQFGILNCVVYSSNRYAVAKRRFNILQIAESVKRRSAAKFPGGYKLNSSLKRSLRCRRIIRRSQEKAMQRLEEGIKPKSRKKRFKRMGPHEEEIECEPLRKKIYSRWIRSLFGEYTTTDPRLMPLDRLFELSEKGDGTLDDVIPHEVHYVESKVRLVTGTSGERSVNQISSSENCTSDADCGKRAICVLPPEQQEVADHSGHCFCRPEFYGDGQTCEKIPSSNHREKRLRRDARKDFVVPEHLFYEPAKRASPATTLTGAGEEMEDEDSEFPPKILAFEEEESFLLSDCISDKDCSAHANCIQPVNGHPYCKCRPGFRGNGIFCWEIIDYVPPEETFPMEEEINPKAATSSPNGPMMRLASRTPTADELEDE